MCCIAVGAKHLLVLREIHLMVISAVASPLHRTKKRAFVVGFQKTNFYKISN